MQIDLDHIRRHYTSLSDEALLDINRAELVEAAQQCYDDELARRPWLTKPKRYERTAAAPVPSPEPEEDLEPERDRRTSLPVPEGAEEEPEWLAGSATACAFSAISAMVRGTSVVPQLEEARHALIAAGIPSHLVVERMDPEPDLKPYFNYEVKVPGHSILEAVSTLDVEVFNPQSEQEWRGLFAAMSDDELIELDPHDLVSGWRDRVQRMLRVYTEEMDRRGLPALSAEENRAAGEGVA